MKILHATDIHLDHIKNPNALDHFVGAVRVAAPDVVLIGGDIAQCDSMERHLPKLARFDIPTYFVLGNHDAYGGSVDGSRIVADRIARRLPAVGYLESST